MNRRISLNDSDWLFKDFYGEDWRWRDSHLPEGHDTRHWRRGSVPGCPHHDLWRLGEIENPHVFGKPDFFERALEHLRES